MITAGVMAVKVLCKGHLVLYGDVDQVQLKNTKDSYGKCYHMHELFCTIG